MYICIYCIYIYIHTYSYIYMYITELIDMDLLHGMIPMVSEHRSLKRIEVTAWNMQVMINQLMKCGPTCQTSYRLLRSSLVSRMVERLCLLMDPLHSTPSDLQHRPQTIEGSEKVGRKKVMKCYESSELNQFESPFKWVMSEDLRGVHFVNIGRHWILSSCCSFLLLSSICYFPVIFFILSFLPSFPFCFLCLFLFFLSFIPFFLHSCHSFLFSFFSL